MAAAASCEEQAVVQAEVLAAFRRHSALVDQATGTIEWHHFCRVLQVLDPASYTDVAIKTLSKQVLKGEENQSNTRLKLEALIDKIFELDAGSAGSDPPPPVPVVNVRRFNGDAVQSLVREEVANLTCLKLRTLCAKAVNRRVPEVVLIYQTRKMEDSEMIEEFLPPEGEGVLELFLVVNPLPQFDSNQPAIGQLDALKWMLTSPEVEEQMTACREFRRLLSIEHLPPIDRVVELGLVPRLLELCQERDHPLLQFEAAWALTNVASGTTEQTRTVVDNGGVEIFVELLRSPNGDVREQAVWALGNIAGDSPALRDVVLSAGALQPVAELYGQTQSITFKRNAVWTISNFCRGKPSPNLWRVLPALPVVSRAIYSADEEILTDAAWVLSYVADGPNDRIQAVLDTGILPRVIELLTHASASVQTAALRTVGNIVTGEDQQTQQVINNGGLECFRALLEHPKRGIRKECCWAISNVTAGTRHQIQSVIDSQLIPPVLALLAHGEHEIRKEAIWVIRNAASGGSFLQITEIVSLGCLPHLVQVLGTRERHCGKLALGAIKNILEVGHREHKAEGLESNPFVEPLLEAGAQAAVMVQSEVFAAEGEVSTDPEEVLALLRNEPIGEAAAVEPPDEMELDEGA